MGTDCNDEDTYLYPSAAYLDDINACMRDVDGDGYGVQLIRQFLWVRL